MIASVYPCSVSYGANTAIPYSLSQRHQLIERRAYEKWRAKGCPRGSALQNWLEAEQEVDEPPRRELIARRAYEIWRRKGCPSMTSQLDWLEAEREVDTALEINTNAYLYRTNMPAELVIG